MKPVIRAIAKGVGLIGFGAVVSIAGAGISARGAAVLQTRSGNVEQEGGSGPAAARLTRGKKLVLKDGNFQLVREYQRNGDRVRYLSAERGDWEEIPAAMVDWDATARAEAAEKSDQAAFAGKVGTREQAQRIETIMDVDASLQVAPGVFLPPGEGMFAIDGKMVTPLEQAGAAINTDKKQFLKQVLS